MPRVLLVSNRLPVTLARGAGGLQVHRSSGGLATALASVHGEGTSRWVGWAGPVEDVPFEAVVAALEPHRAVPVPLTSAEVRGYYDGFSNGVLWPLCHYLLDKVQLDAHQDWQTWVQVNARFADAVAAEWRPGDQVWVHDYQLMLVPALLRQRCPGARIGFFLHVPFPSAEVFRILPWREEILRGVLGADLVGFHTAAYAYHFTYVASQVLGLELTPEVIDWEGRSVRVGAFPIGIDVARHEGLAADDAVRARARQLRDEAGGRCFVLGVDRLDYTKGIPRRLMALERLLARREDLRDRLHVVQLAVPTREKVDAYAEYRRTVNELVGRLNGAFGTPTRNVVHLLHRALPPEELAALYLAADVMLVTPLRDGMNLVAKEYVASRLDDSGALVLSEFAGAATQLHEALHVNPYDLDAVAVALERAVELPPAEQAVRMAALRQTVREGDVARWAAGFLEALGASAAGGSVPPPSGLAQALADLRAAPHRVLLLDYDGTLVPFASSPDAAAPDQALRHLLARLAAQPGTAVHVVSGRSRESLERFLGDLPVGLHAEHGLWSRPGLGMPWHSRSAVPPGWRKEVAARLAAAVRATDGALLEEKSGALAFHFRATEPQLARRRVDALKAELQRHPRSGEFELLEGNRVLEVRPRGVHKGVVVAEVLAGAPHAALLVVGDDRTDEDLFLASPAEAVTVHVGSGPSAARYRVADVSGARLLLERLLGGWS